MTSAEVFKPLVIILAVIRALGLDGQLFLFHLCLSLRSCLCSLRTLTELSPGLLSHCLGSMLIVTLLQEGEPLVEPEVLQFEAQFNKEKFHILLSVQRSFIPGISLCLCCLHIHQLAHDEQRLVSYIMHKQFNIGFILAENLVSSQSESTLGALFANSKRDFICLSPRRGFHLAPLL